MSELTAKDLRAAARHARELAMECVNGTAPQMITGQRRTFVPGEHCVLGWIEVRSGVRRADVETPEATDLAWIVAEANNEALDHADRMIRLPIPLLALGDALDLAARQRRPQKAP